MPKCLHWLLHCRDSGSVCRSVAVHAFRKGARIHYTPCCCPMTRALPHLTASTESLGLSLTHTHTRSFIHSLAKIPHKARSGVHYLMRTQNTLAHEARDAHKHSLPKLTDTLTHARTHPLTHEAHSLTHSLTHSLLIYSPTHSLTNKAHSLTHKALIHKAHSHTYKGH